MTLSLAGWNGIIGMARRSTFLFIPEADEHCNTMLSLEYIGDKRDELTAKQLADFHRNDLPMLVVVSTGFYGNREEMTFSTGQVNRKDGG